MSNHRTKIVDQGDQWIGRCTCRWMTQPHQEKWKVEDELRAHGQVVERVKAYLGTRTPSLQHQYNYFRGMELSAPTEHDRLLWKQLADELEQRLGQQDQDDPLF